MTIKTKDELFEMICRKTSKSRKKALRTLKSAFSGTQKKNFQPFEIERSIVEMSSIVPHNAFNSLISRRDVRKLNDKDPDELEFKEGETTVADITRFFFPSHKNKKKKKG